MATVTFGDFEWDVEKAIGNVAKHGVTFEEAITVFLDLSYLLIRDAVEPERFVAMGMSRQARVLICRTLRARRQGANHQCPARNTPRVRDV